MLVLVAVWVPAMMPGQCKALSDPGAVWIGALLFSAQSVDNCSLVVVNIEPTKESTGTRPPVLSWLSYDKNNTGPTKETLQVSLISGRDLFNDVSV
jgi:hypothetical protein